MLVDLGDVSSMRVPDPSELADPLRSTQSFLADSSSMVFRIRAQCGDSGSKRT